MAELAAQEAEDGEDEHSNPELQDGLTEEPMLPEYLEGSSGMVKIEKMEEDE
jgi:hypothetical protein